MSVPADHLDPSIQRLEERVAWLQKHVTEQDKVILELSELVARLRRDFAELRDRQAQADSSGPSGGIALPDERPPHY